MIVCCCSISRPSIDNFFRSKRVILSLTLKERAIHVCLASLLRQYPSIDNFFRSKGVFTHLRFLFVLASSLACFFVYTLGEICGRSFFRTRNRTLHSPLCVFGPSIKSGTWNIPEHAGTFRNIPEHRIIIIIMRNICKIRFFLTELRRGGIGSVGIHPLLYIEQGLCDRPKFMVL